MIQRKQSLYLLVATILSFVCLILPVGSFMPEGVGVNSLLYNLWIKDGNGAISFVAAPLFVVLSVSVIITVSSIFLFKNRRLQIKFCSWNLFLLFVWYVIYAFVCFSNSTHVGSFKLEFPVVLPMVSLILVYMARRAIRSDEALVRAADRIR